MAPYARLTPSGTPSQQGRGGRESLPAAHAYLSMLKELLTQLSSDLDISLDEEFVATFLESIKGALPASREVMDRDFKLYTDKLAARLQGEGVEKMDITLAFQSWSMTWMASQMTLISGLLLMALSGSKEIENGIRNGVPKSPLVP
jgi:hypothetical protein